MQTYKDLRVWQKAIELIFEIYKITNLLPTEEKFGLSSQMRRSAISIPSNIAEGYGRRGKKENANFINISYGSALELETQIIVTKKLNYVSNQEWDKADKLLSEILPMLYKYREYLQTPS